MYIKMYITHDQLLSGNLRILESCAIWKKKKDSCDLQYIFQLETNSIS